MKIAITGSNGFVASQLIPLLSKKHEVIKIEEDVLNIEKMRPYFKNKDIDFVIHLAVKRSGDHIYETIVEGTKNMAQLCHEYCFKLINFSSECAGTDPSSPYATGKLIAEKFIEDAAKYAIDGLEAVSIKPCGIRGLNGCDSAGNKLDIFRSIYYPIEWLHKDIEKIMANHYFGKYKVFRTRIPCQGVFCFIGRVYRIIKRRVLRVLKILKILDKNYLIT